MYTRWNSAAWTKSNGEEAGWFQLAWQRPRSISRIRIHWGETYAVEYQLKLSSNGKSWRTIREVTDGAGGVDVVKHAGGKARYLRIDGKRGTKGISAYSIREVEVYEE
jgi:hypothetical protein